MASKPTRQVSFAGGEWSPEMYGRTDLQRYQSAVRKMENMFVTPRGVAKNRPGTEFVAEVKTSADKVRLVPFVFNIDQSYVLEFGDKYMRVHADGATVLIPQGTHTGPANNASLVDINQGPHKAGVGVGKLLTNITKSETTTITSSFQYEYFGVLSGGADWDIDDKYSIGGASFEITTPWDLAAISALKLQVAQANDVMVICHPDFHPHELRRYGETDWKLTALKIDRDIQPPTNITHANAPFPTADTTHPAEDWDWVVTSVDKSGNESVASVAFTAPSPPVVLNDEWVKPRFTWSAPAQGPAVDHYRVYRGRYSVFGLVGESEGTTFTDSNFTPDYSQAPPEARNPFVRETDPVTHGIELATDPQPPALVGDGSIVILKDANTIQPSSENPATEAWLDEYLLYWDVVARPTSINFIGVDADIFVESKPAGGSFSVHQQFKIKFESYGVTVNRQWVNVTRIKADLLVVDAEFRIRVVDQSHFISNEVDTNFRRVEYRLLDEAGFSEPSYPTAVCFFEQRLVFGGLLLSPTTFIGSRIGQIRNFDRQRPLRDDGPFELALASLRNDGIRWIVPLEALVIGTASAIWVVQGAQGFPLGPLAYDMKPRSHIGVGDLAPAVVGRSILYADERRLSLYEYQFQPEGGASEPRDLTVLAGHIFQRHSIEELDYARTPDSILWVIRSDGTLCGLTYMLAHDMWGWHRQLLGGTDTVVENAAVIPETLPIGAEVVSGAYVNKTRRESVPYFVVSRTINGATKRYIERLSSRYFVPCEMTKTDGTKVHPTRDATFLDSMVTFDGRNKAATQYRLKDPVGGLWVAGTEMTLESDTGTPFVAADVGFQFELLGSDGEAVRVLVTAVAGAPAATCTVDAVTNVPTTLQTTYVKTWAKCLNAFTLNPNHLEGQTVGILVDGGSHATKVVTSAVVTLDSGVFAAVCQIGLPYTAKLDSLPLELGVDARMKRKTPHRVGVEVDEWRGIYVGQYDNDLVQVAKRDVTLDYGGISPKNQLVKVRPRNNWEDGVSISIQQPDPLPLTVLSIIAEVKIGG